jgi:hypothetical protein
LQLQATEEELAAHCNLPPLLCFRCQATEEYQLALDEFEVIARKQGIWRGDEVTQPGQPARSDGQRGGASKKRRKKG